MESINDSEFLPSFDALVSFRNDADTKIHPIGRAIWEKLDITEDKATALASRLLERKSNTHRITANQYARAIWNDGIKKGWLNDLQ